MAAIICEGSPQNNPERREFLLRGAFARRWRRPRVVMILPCAVALSCFIGGGIGRRVALRRAAVRLGCWDVHPCDGRSAGPSPDRMATSRWLPDRPLAS